MMWENFYFFIIRDNCCCWKVWKCSRRSYFKMTCEWAWEKFLFLVFDFHYGQIFCPFQKRKYFTNFGFRSHYDYEKQKQKRKMKKKNRFSFLFLTPHYARPYIIWLLLLILLGKSAGKNIELWSQGRSYLEGFKEGRIYFLK